MKEKDENKRERNQLTSQTKQINVKIGFPCPIDTNDDRTAN